MKHSAFRAALLLVSGLVAGAAITGTAWAYQTHMHAALDDLYAAKSQLQASASDKGGHRVNAINLVNRAINETRAGIAIGAQ